MAVMKTLFSRILLAQLIVVLLALVVVTVITRASLGRSFKGFLETQEPNVLQTLVPVFADLYETNGGWGFLQDNPENWHRIWHLTRRPPGPARVEGRRTMRERRPPESGGEYRMLRWMRPQERGIFRDRLFLLDADQSWIGGALMMSAKENVLESIEIDGKVVGWIGFAPLGSTLPPDAERFLAGQVRITAISFAIALLGAVTLSFFLARKVSGPVRQLGGTVRALSRGLYESRAPVKSRDEMGILAEHVNQLAKTLEKNRTARQRWMADIAHELRTPVAVLKGEVEALADGVRQADDGMYHSLHEEVDQLASLVDDLQTLAMSDAGALSIEKETLDLSELVSSCVDTYRERMETRGIRIDLHIANALTVPGDQRRLRQLLSNLLENSSRYVEEGGTVRVSVFRSSTAAELVLEDSGPGLESEQIQRLFERFYRVESSRSRSRGGSGLGLSICRNIAEAHGGNIRAGSSAMGGLKIQVLLPI